MSSKAGQNAGASPAAVPAGSTLLAGAVGSAAQATSKASAKSHAVSGPFYTLQNVESMKFMNVSNNSTKPEAIVWQWDTQNDSSQWEFLDIQTLLPSTPVAGSTYYIRNKHSLLYLNVKENSLADGATIWQYPFEKGYKSMQWKLERSLFHPIGLNLRNVQSGKYANVKGNSHDNGADLIQYGEHPDYRSNRWIISLVPESSGGEHAPTASVEQESRTSLKSGAPDSVATSVAGSSQYYVIQNKNSMRFMNVENNSKEAGAPIWQWRDDSQPAQPIPDASQWEFTDRFTGLIAKDPQDGETYCIRNKNSGLYLVVEKNKTDDLAPILQYTFERDHLHAYKSMEFTLKKVPNAALPNEYNIINVNSERLLNVKGNGKANGSIIQQWSTDQYGNPSNQWIIKTVGSLKTGDLGEAGVTEELISPKIQNGFFCCM